MKKTKNQTKKLALSRETIHTLESKMLLAVSGGEREGGGASVISHDPVCFYTTLGN